MYDYLYPQIKTIYHEESHAGKEELLIFCNEVRRAGGGNPIEALMPGIQGRAKVCLIAKNLNFDCSVKPHIDPTTGEGTGVTSVGNKAYKAYRNWVMSDLSDDVALNIARYLHLPIVSQYEPIYNSIQLAILLPRRIGNAAQAFDDGIDFTSLISGSLLQEF